MRLSFFMLKGLPFPGGVERYMEEIGPRLVARGHQVRVYSVSYRTTVEPVYKGMNVCRVGALPFKALEKPMAALNAAIRECVGDADVVHAHAFGPSLFGILPQLAGKRLVIQGHGLEWRRSKWGTMARALLRLSEWASVRAADAVTVVSRTQQTYLLKTYGVESAYIPPGVSAPTCVGPSEIHRFGLAGGDYILFAARLEREKGLGHLINAYKRLSTGVKLVIAGDNPLDGTYKDEMHRLAADDARIVFTGFARGRLLQELFSNCICFVLPSELEGLPIAVLEAMSYGCACVVSDIPENLEALAGHGFSFRNRDPEDLSRKLAAVLDDPVGAKSMGTEGRQYALGTFDWDRVAASLEGLYRSVATAR